MECGKRETGKMRSSNIELLRIAAMLMIILYHIVSHCVNVQLTDPASMARWGNGWFNHPLIYKKLWILYSAMPLGIIGNVIFIVVSGFFTVKKGEGIRIGGVAKKLLLQMGFASVALTLLSAACHYFLIDTMGGYIGLLSITSFNEMSWFTGYYFAVILAAFLFLNRFLSGLGRERYAAFLISMFALISFRWTTKLADELALGLSTLGLGIFLYSLGGFLSLHDPFREVKSSALVLAILLSFGLLCVSHYNLAALNIENYLRGGAQGEFIQKVSVYHNNSAPLIVIGVALFELFRRLRIPNDPAVNFLGSATFMIYLMHDNDFFYSLWHTQDWITPLYRAPLRFLLKLSLWTLAVFAAGTLSYCCYLGLLGVFKKRLGRGW